MLLQKNTAVDACRGMASLLVVWSHFASLIQAANFFSSTEFYSLYGSWLVYLSRGSAVYFFVISGYVIASKLPEWQRYERGLFVRGFQRMSRILCIFWCGLLIILLCNYAKQLVSGQSWSRLVPYNIACEFLLIFNWMDCKGRLIPPDWYLEVDLVLLVSVLFIYALYVKLDQAWKSRARVCLWLCTIPLTMYSLNMESQYIMGAHATQGLIRSLSYFVLGILAWQARYHRSALFCFIINSVAFIIINDHSNLMHYLCTNAAVLLAWLLFCSTQIKSVSDLFNQPIFTFMNKVSFAVFIFHYFLLILWISLARHLVPQSMTALTGFMLLSFPVIYGFAWVFHLHVEKPLLKFHDALWAGTLWQPKPFESPVPVGISNTPSAARASAP